MSLFVLASKDGWVNIMYHGLDAVGIDQQVETYTYAKLRINIFNKIQTILSQMSLISADINALVTMLFFLQLKCLP